MIVNYKTARYFYNDLKEMIADTTETIDEEYFLAVLNYALRQLASEPKLDILFKKHDRFKLAELSVKGDAETSWGLENEIIDVQNLAIYDASNKDLCRLSMCYLAPNDFYASFPMPEENPSGISQYYTIDFIDGESRLVFDRPIDRPIIVDIRFTAFPEEITSLDDKVKLPIRVANYILDAIRERRYESDSDGNFVSLVNILTTYDMAMIKTMVYRRPTVGGARIIGGMR